MTPSVHRFQGDSDVWRIRAFLREAFLANERHARSWHVARFDYARWHVYRNVVQVPLEDIAWLWESDGRVVGLVMPDGGLGEAHLSLAPRLRSGNGDTTSRRRSQLARPQRVMASARSVAGSSCSSGATRRDWRSTMAMCASRSTTAAIPAGTARSSARRCTVATST